MEIKTVRRPSAPTKPQSIPRSLPNPPIPIKFKPKPYSNYEDFSVIGRFGGDVSGHACFYGLFLNDPRVGLPLVGSSDWISPNLEPQSVSINWLAYALRKRERDYPAIRLEGSV